jgi:hypothetical protein
LGAPVSNEELSFIARYRTAEFGCVDMNEISVADYLESGHLLADRGHPFALIRPLGYRLRFMAQWSLLVFDVPCFYSATTCGAEI